MADERESYTVELDDAREMPGVGLIVTSWPSGRVSAMFSGGNSLVIGEPLCSGCDAPIADGPCGCMERAEK